MISNSVSICLINPPVNQHADPVDIPLQLLLLGAVCRQVGHQPVCLDFNLLTKYNPNYPLSPRFFSAAIDLVQTYDPDVIAFSCISSTLPFVLKLACQYKTTHPECLVLLGGPQATLLHRQILERHSYIDMVCRGEGEITLLECLDCLENLDFRQVRGLSYRSANGEIYCNPDRDLMENLDECPFPAYDLIDLDSYRKLYPEIAVPIEAGRGCPFNCCYCSTSVVWRRKFRLKSVGRLIEEIKDAIRRTGIKKFRFIHDHVAFDGKWIISLCQALKELDDDIVWSCDTRVDAVSSEILEEMAAAGCKAIFYGIETGSYKLQKEFGKNIDLDQAVTIIRESCKSDLQVTLSFILGYPTETQKDLTLTLQFIFLLFIMRLKIGLVLNIFNPEFGTRSYDDFHDNMSLNMHTLSSDLPFLTPEIEGFIHSDRELFSHFYNANGSQCSMQTLLKIITLLPIIQNFQSVLYFLLDREDDKLISSICELFNHTEETIRFHPSYRSHYEVERFVSSAFEFIAIQDGRPYSFNVDQERVVARDLTNIN